MSGPKDIKIAPDNPARPLLSTGRGLAQGAGVGSVQPAPAAIPAPQIPNLFTGLTPDVMSAGRRGIIDLLARAGMGGDLASSVSRLGGYDQATRLGQAVLGQRAANDQQWVDLKLPPSPLGGGGAMVPTGPITLGSGSRVVTQGPKPMAGLEGFVRESGEKQLDAAKEMSRVEQEQARGEAEVISETRAKADQIQARREAKLQKLEQDRDVELSLYREARQRAAEEKIDPNGWWSSRTAGQQAMALIGVALGAFGEGFTGGRVKNAALRIVEREIDRDLQVQVANMKKKQGERAEQLGIVSTLNGLIKNEQVAMQNARLMLMDSMALQLKEKAAQVKDQRLAAQLMITANQIAYKSKMDENKIFMARQPTIRKTSAWRQVAPKAGATDVKKLGDANYLEAAQTYARLARRVSQGGRWSASVALGGMWPGQTTEKSTEAARQMFGVALAKAAGAGQLSNEERIAATGTVLGHNQYLPAQLANVREGYATILGKAMDDMRRARAVGDMRRYQYVRAQIPRIQAMQSSVVNLVSGMSSW